MRDFITLIEAIGGAVPLVSPLRWGHTVEGARGGARGGWAVRPLRPVRHAAYYFVCKMLKGRIYGALQMLVLFAM